MKVENVDHLGERWLARVSMYERGERDGVVDEVKHLTPLNEIAVRVVHGDGGERLEFGDVGLALGLPG